VQVQVQVQVQVLQGTRMPDSPNNLLPVARLVGLFGIGGEFKCRASTAGEEAVKAGRIFFLDAEGKRAVTVTMVRRRQKRIIVKLADIETVEAAQPLLGALLYFPQADIHLGEGEFLDQDLIGLRLCDPEGRELGVVRAVEHYPAQDCLLIEPGHVLVPLVQEFISAIDTAQGRIIARLPEGLLEPERAEKG
jgi:16S rRNA processing protein RimM